MALLPARALLIYIHLSIDQELQVDGNELSSLSFPSAYVRPQLPSPRRRIRHSPLLNFTQLAPAQLSDWPTSLCGAYLPSREPTPPPHHKLSFNSSAGPQSAEDGGAAPLPPPAAAPPRAASGPAGKWDVREGVGRGGGQGFGPGVAAVGCGPRRPHSSGARRGGAEGWARLGSARLSPYTQAPAAWGNLGLSSVRALSRCKLCCAVAGLGPGPARPGERWGRSLGGGLGEGLRGGEEGPPAGLGG